MTLTPDELRRVGELAAEDPKVADLLRDYLTEGQLKPGEHILITAFCRDDRGRSLFGTQARAELARTPKEQA